MFATSCEPNNNNIEILNFSVIHSSNELARSSSFYCVLGSKGYVGTGRNTYNTQLKDFWAFDLQNLQWERKADFSGISRVKAVAVACNGKIYAGLGYSIELGNLQPQSYLKDFYVYTPDSNSWKRLTDYPNSFTDACFAFSCNNKVFISTGFDGVSFSKQTWMFDPITNTWTSVGNFSGGPITEAMCIDNGRIFAGTGFPFNRNDWHEFDTITFKWKKHTSMPDKGRIKSLGFVINEKMFIAGGRHWGGDGDARQTLKTIFLYEPENDSWVKAGDLPDYGTENGVSFSFGNKAFIGFGENDWGAVNNFWQITIDTNN